MPGLSAKDVEEIFSYHAPTDAQVVTYTALRTKAAELALLMLDLVPESAERTIALRSLQETVMFANAAIALHTPEP